jgi:hypothetical protein
MGKISAGTAVVFDPVPAEECQFHGPGNHDASALYASVAIVGVDVHALMVGGQFAEEGSHQPKEARIP